MSEHHSPVDPSDATIAPEAGTAPSLTDIARDPALIAGIYDGCDQWCVYCRATGRCLALRHQVRVGGVFDPAGADDGQGPGGSLLLKVLADVEGRLAPPEIEAVASGDPRLVQQVFDLDDPLERLGRRYMMLAGAYLGSLPDFAPSAGHWRPEGPSPLEVLAWFHVLAPARVYRAILADTEARRGIRGRRADALRAAKVALIGLNRSASAIRDHSNDRRRPSTGAHAGARASVAARSRGKVRGSAEVGSAGTGRRVTAPLEHPAWPAEAWNAAAVARRTAARRRRDGPQPLERLRSTRARRKRKSPRGSFESRASLYGCELIPGSDLLSHAPTHAVPHRR